MKISFNESTAKGCSTLAQDLEICNDVGFDFIEIRLDMLKDYLRTHSERELKQFFADHRIQPHAINALYTYRELFSKDDTAARREALMEEFLFGCKIAEQIGSHAFIVVPPMSADPRVP